MANDIFQQSITPQKPNILRQQRINVYVPTATKDTSGIASFEERDFNVNDGHVTLMWPQQMLVERLADPLANVSYVKVIEDEFENTGKEATVINPVTGVTYKSNTAEVKLRRKGRNATVRPDLIKVTSHDFDTAIDENGEIVHTLAVHNPLEEPSFIQVDKQDFNRSNNIVQINWPYAHNASGSSRTNGYGLIKIAPNSEHYLKYVDGVLAVDDLRLADKINSISPIYGGTVANGFTNLNDYVDANGKAKRNENDNIVIAITKESVGLSKVANRSFDSWQYEEFGESMKTTFDSKFALKLDKTTWNSLFNDWAPPSNEERTPELRFDKLVGMHNAQQEQIDTLKEIKSFLGYFEDLAALVAIYPASEKFLGCNAYLLTPGSYWNIRKDEFGAYEWYDTEVKTVNFSEYIETDPKRLKPNGEASVGSSGLWVQSDHVHPTDTTRLAVSLYKATNVNIYSQSSNYLPDDIQDFKFNMWNEDADGIYKDAIKVNIPYVRKAKGIHNWAGSHGVFEDSEASLQKIWVGSKAQFETDSILPNSIAFVDDGEGFEAESPTVSAEDIYKAGLVLDQVNQSEQIVITDTNSASDLVDKYLTLNIVTRADGNKAYKLAEKLEKTYTPNRIMVSNDEGYLEDSTIPSDKVVIRLGEEFGTNQLILGQGGQKVIGVSTGNVANRPIVSNGIGGVSLMGGADTNGSIVILNEDGSLEPTGLVEYNVLVTSVDTKPTLLPANELLLSGMYNTVNTYNTGAENAMLVSNGLGSLKRSTIGAGKLLYTSAVGTPAAFPMSPADAGKVIGVSLEGTPTLISVIHPSELPITTLTEAPTEVNNSGTKLVVLDSEPETLYDGYLYMW